MIGRTPLELRPDPGPARAWLRNELAKPEYQQSLLQRGVHWFWHQLGKFADAAEKVGRLSPAIALGLLVLLLLGLALVLARLRREPRSGATDRAVLEDPRTTAAQYRDRAASALAEERWNDAVVEGMRAIAIGLVERALVDDLPSATAHEVATAASAVFAGERAGLEAAARLFDDVRYGDRQATRTSATELLDLERRVRSLRPDTGVRSDPVMAVPQ